MFIFQTHDRIESMLRVYIIVAKESRSPELFSACWTETEGLALLRK